MKKRKIAWYLSVIASLLAISMVTPVIINTIADRIVERVERKEPEETTKETENEEMAEISIQKPSQEESSLEQAQVTGKPEEKSKERDRLIIVDDDFYDPPVYATQEEEDAANRETYERMVSQLQSEAEAVAAYRASFSPVYDELSPGLMDDFISGREQLFYTEVANYCFGQYNTTYEISKILFDAIIDENAEQVTAILEFFTREDLYNAMHVPDLAICTYHKNTQSFVFFQSAGR